MDVFSALLHETLVVTILLTLPILGVATIVGLAIAVLQAATSLQEQSLGVLPKIGLVGLAIVVAAPCGLAIIEDLFKHAVAAIPVIVAGGSS